MILQKQRQALFLGIFIILFLGYPSYGALPEEYVAVKGYGFSEKEMLLLQNLGELSAVEEAFVDCLSLRSSEEREKLLVRYALDGRILLTEYQEFCDLPREIPQDPAKILEAIMSSLNREYFIHTFKDRKFKLRMQLAHWREDTKGRFDDPRQIELLMDALFLWMKISPDYYEGDRSYEIRTEQISRR
ncbi:MAG TPA: hypothetical protein PK364_13545 [Synergistaceae bacterium]|nr:hypothetical protein [Synergistaceae bacterium]